MIRFRRTTLITGGCFAVLAGLGLSRLLNLEIHSSWLLLLPVFLLLKRKNLTSLIITVLFGLGLGLWQGGVYMQRLAELRNLNNRNITIRAVVKSDAIYSKTQQLEFTANKAHLVTNDQPLTGSFKISGFGPAMVYRGDTIQATGKLYLTRGSNQAGISFAQLSVTGQDTSLINKLTRKFSAGMQSALPEPLASFGLGLLIGQRSTLPQDILSQLTLVGLVHIVAVSGYNVTILVRAVGRLKLGSKYQKLVLSLTLIGAFVLITGFSASIVRAGIVSALTLWAWFYGRKIRPVVLLSFTAALTGIINPFYVWSDIGWYLSFLAFSGILIISPLIIARFFAKTPKLVGLVIIETLCAELMTLPLIMATFGQFSLVALVANVLVVPLVPLAMLLGSIAMVAGAWLPAIAGWFAWPAKELLSYMLDIVHLLASLPFATKQLSVNWAGMAVVYLGLASILFGLRRKARKRRGVTVEIL